MENTSLHTQKVAILSRLIKESSLTLEEALLLLKEEEVEKTPVQVSPSWISGTSTPYTQPYFGSGILPLTGSSTGTVTLNTNGSNTTTTFSLNTPTADLNN
jgi:hypothetical protein